MFDILMNYGMQALYAVTAVAVGYAWREFKEESKEYYVIKAGMRSLLRERLIHMCEKCIHGGYCSTDYNDAIEEMYKDYHALGGNGTVTKLLRHVEALPIDPPEKSNG